MKISLPAGFRLGRGNPGKKNNGGAQAPRGFTLIEFVVIISIFAIMASVALVNFAGFRSDIGLNNLAHDIALTLRQAQVFGWSTQSFNDSSASQALQFDAAGNPLRFADGVYFAQAQAGSFDREFIMYQKTDSNVPAFFVPNQAANPNGVPDTVVDTIKIQGPNHISAILSSQTSAADLALVAKHIPANSGSVAQVTTDFSVAFSRPRPEAMFFEGANVPVISPFYYGIYISADTDGPGIADHVIIISKLGEITVQ